MLFLNKEEPVNRKVILILGAIIIFPFLYGCAGPSRLEMDYGTSFKLQKFNQILDPDAGKNLESTEGLDGRAAGAAVDRYYKGFAEPEKAPVYNLNIGVGK